MVGVFDSQALRMTVDSCVCFDQTWLCIFSVSIISMYNSSAVITAPRPSYTFDFTVFWLTSQGRVYTHCQARELEERFMDIL